MLADRYRLEAPLGHGGMGEVWRGWDTRLSRPVAVKLLAASAAGDEASADRFRDEARTAARLNHPRVVAVYDFGVSDGCCFLVMELVDGCSLTEELLREGTLSPDRAASVAAQAAAGLAAAHRRGVVHRDIKPSNLLATADGTVKIADFGIARCPSGESTTNVTTTGEISGTSLYLAPETALGKAAGPAGDVYSLGCTLYELLTGRPPFTADSPLAVLYQHVEAEPAAPGDRCPRLPGAFGAFLLRMLAKTPAERPTAGQTADWFAGGAWRQGGERPGAGDATEHVEVPATLAVAAPTSPGEPTSISSPSPAPAPAPVGKRARVLAVAAAAAAVVAATAVVLTGPPVDGGARSGTPAGVPHHTAQHAGPAGTGGTGSASLPGSLAAPADDAQQGQHGPAARRTPTGTPAPTTRGTTPRPTPSASQGTPTASPSPSESPQPTPSSTDPGQGGPQPTPSGTAGQDGSSA